MKKNYRKHINIRDLGGYESADGRTIKHGLVYRSGGLYLMNDSELSHLHSLGIMNVLDLRTEGEASVNPDPDVSGANMMRHSGIVFPDGREIDFSPAGMRLFGDDCARQVATIHNYYAHMPFDNQALHILMDCIKSHDVPVLFHCATGKDRTGVAAMVVLLALGIPDDTVFDDYLLSNEYHEDGIKNLVAENQHLIDEHPEMLELVHMWSGVTPATGHTVLDSIKSRCGSYESYLESEFGLGSDDIAALRDYYLE